MVWDKNEITILIFVIFVASVLTLFGVINPSVVEYAIMTVIGYTTGRVFNNRDGKELVIIEPPKVILEARK